MFEEIPANEWALKRRKLVHGVGVNDADYIVTSKIGGEVIRCPFYNAWKNMLKRAYFGPYKQKNPTYIGCSVCGEWLIFSNFKTWMKRQDWQGKELDKDILTVGNKIYSPETCCFVSHEINSLIHHFSGIGRTLPKGVYLSDCGRKYTSGISISGKLKHLGTHLSVASAQNAYRSAKIDEILRLANMRANAEIREGLYNQVEYLRNCDVAV